MLSRSAALLLPLLALPASAATLHVPAQFPTIQSAIDSATNGDEIVVATGTYIETIFIQGKDIHLLSLDPTDPTVVEATIIDASLEDSVVTFEGTETSACILAGFTIRNGYGVKGGGISGNGCDATIRRNRILENTSQSSGGGVRECDGLIEHNEIGSNRANMGGGLDLCDGIIRGNFIWHNEAEDFLPFHTQGRGGGLSQCNGSIYNNVIARNFTNGPGGGLEFCSASVENNTFYRNGATSGRSMHNCFGSITGNIFWESYGNPLENSTAPWYCLISNQGLVEDANGNLDADPRFVDPANLDFHLRPDSPCIDAGQGFGYLTEDIEGTPRPFLATDLPRGDRSHYDMGAYEFVGQAEPNPPPNRPVNVSPEDGETVFGFNPLMVSSPFVDDDPSDIHTRTEWQVDDVPNIDPNNLVVGWLSDEEDLLQITVVDEGQYLPAGTTFWWKIRHRDSYANWSAWSIPTRFNTRSAGTLHVPDDLPTIQAALDVSTPGDKIVVAPGTYPESLVFNVGEVTLCSQDPQSATVVQSTILDGPAYPYETLIMNAHGITLSGLTIRGAKEGIQCHYHDKLIEDCIITSGKIEQSGGTIQNCKLTLEGGLENCHGLIQGNEITNGRGIFSSQPFVPCRADVIGNYIAYCHATALASCRGTIEGNLIVHNRGGALYRCNGIIHNNIISHNSTTLYGAGLSYCDGQIGGNIITYNAVIPPGNNVGGLLHCNGTIINNLIAFNSAVLSYGGLAACNGDIIGNTIYGNFSIDESGGIGLCTGRIINNVIWANESGRGAQVFESSTPEFCCIQDWDNSENGNIPDDPQLKDPQHLDFRLLPNSPCIDAGTFIEELKFDYEGEPRPMDGTLEERGDGSEIDIGADEFYSFFNLRADLNSDGQVDHFDLFEIQSDWFHSPPIQLKHDVNLDDITNPMDLEIIISDWKRGTSPW